MDKADAQPVQPTMGLKQRLGAIRLNRDRKIDTPMFDARVATKAQTRSFNPTTSAAWSFLVHNKGNAKGKGGKGKGGKGKGGKGKGGKGKGGKGKGGWGMVAGGV